MDQRAQVSPQRTPFEAPLTRYLRDTLRRERRRRYWAGTRLGLLLIASLLACQLPYVRSNAADSFAVARVTDQAPGKIAAFACPNLQILLAERRVPPAANLQRLTFAGAIFLSRHDAL